MYYTIERKEERIRDSEQEKKKEDILSLSAVGNKKKRNSI